MFSQTYPLEFKQWYRDQQNLIVLAATNEKQLIKLAETLSREGILHVVFKEPDINHQVTAIAIEPAEKAYKLTSSLPLVLKT